MADTGGQSRKGNKRQMERLSTGRVEQGQMASYVFHTTEAGHVLQPAKLIGVHVMMQLSYQEKFLGKIHTLEKRDFGKFLRLEEFLLQIYVRNQLMQK